MRKAGLILATIGLSICFSLSPQQAKTASLNPTGNSSFPLATIPGKRELETADLNDSDEFFQDALHTRGRKPDYSQKIENLLKQMTVDEKVGQMTQLTLEMIVSGHDQNIQIDPVKLQKAIGQYGVGSIINVYDQALTLDKWQDLITQIQGASCNSTLPIW